MPRLLVLCVLLLLFPAKQAAAEWHITPMIGLTTLGSTTIFDAELGTEQRHRNYGGAVTWLSRGLFGAEVLGSWTPGFFEGQDVDGIDKIKSSRTISLMGNVVVTAPQRWTEYFLRPFVSGGFGLMHVAKTDLPEGLFPVNLNVVGFNVGGGAVGFFSDRAGVRFDIRYHSVLNPSDHGPISIGDVNLRYVTASVGIIFRRP